MMPSGHLKNLSTGLNILTIVGNIQAALPHGPNTTIKSHNGSIRAYLQPIYSRSRNRTNVIRTYVEHGSRHVRVGEPFPCVQDLCQNPFLDT